MVDDQAVVCQCLAAFVRRSGPFRLSGTARSLSELKPLLASGATDVVLLDPLPERRFFEDLAALAARFPQVKFLLLDETIVDAHARQAVRLSLAGYLTKQQSLADIRRALLLAARGQQVYAPEIASRISLTASGARLAPAEDDDVIARLSAREMDVLFHIARGYTVKECAEALGLSASTVDNHKARLMRKLEIHKTADLTRLAIAHGLVPNKRHGGT